MQDDSGNQGPQRWTGRLRRVLGVLLLVLAGGLSGLPSLWLQELGRIGRALPGEASRAGQTVSESEPAALVREIARAAATTLSGPVAETETPPFEVAVNAAPSEPEQDDQVGQQSPTLIVEPATLIMAAAEPVETLPEDRAELPGAVPAMVTEPALDLGDLDVESPMAADTPPDDVTSIETVLAPDSLTSSVAKAEDESWETATMSPAVAEVPTPVQGPIHQVVPGETLSGIAVEYRVDLATLAEANGLDLSVPILVGQRLVVPGGVRQPIVATRPTPPPARPVVAAAPVAPRTTTPVVAAAPVAPRTTAPVVVQRPIAPVPTPVPTKPVAAAAPTPARVLAAQVIPASAAPAVLPGGPLIRPVGGWVSQQFIPGRHNGVDLASATGTPIRAAASGLVVVAAKLSYGYGWRIMLDHGSGLTTLYGHLSRLDVAPGARVSRGQVIGAVGATGEATGPHLHFEVALRGAVVDPLRYLP